MPAYLNLGGNSSVRAYEVSDHAILVTFTDGSKYQYSYASAGRDRVEQMKRLGEQGVGLGSFIQRRAMYLYASKS